MFKFDVEENAVKILHFEEFMEGKKDVPGALMQVLQEAQGVFGYIPEEIVSLISERMGYPRSEIYGVATFYAQFTFVPKGKYAISVCLGTACYVNGAKDILDAFIEELGINVGETTEDLKYSIVETRCVGACAEAPVVMINNDIYPRFKKEDVKKVLSELQ